MSKRLWALIFLVFLCETGIFFWTADLAGGETLSYQLAARYSARISFFMFSCVLLWTGLKGLRSIYIHESSRKLLVELLLLFAINHVIHLYFLSMNFWVNDQSLISARNAGGAVVYLMLTAAPVFLWQRQTLSRQLYQLVYFFFLAITSLFALTYFGRLTREMPMPSSPLYFTIALSLIGSLILLHAYRVWAEYMHMRPTVS